MQLEFAHGFRQARHVFFKWRYEANFETKFMLVFAFAALTGLGAQFRIYLPFTPVPITGQTFFVLLSGVVLGRNYGAASQVLYAGLGAAGMPWFAGMTGGIAVIKGTNGGYIAGFVIAAYVIGWFVDNFVRARRLSFLVPLMLLGTAIIYTFGATWLAVLLNLSAGDAVIKGILPYIPGDAVKAFAVIALSSVLLPKEAYNGELDSRRESKTGYLKNAGIIICIALVFFFLALFWLRMLELKSVEVMQMLTTTAGYSVPLFICSLLAIRFIVRAE